MNKRHDISDPEYRLRQVLDGLADEKQTRRVRQEMQDDPALAEQAKLYASLDSQLEQLAETPFDSEQLEQQRREIMARLERRVLLEGPTHRRRFGLPRLWLGGLAAAAGLVIGLTILLNTILTETVQPPGTVVQVRMRSAWQDRPDARRARQVRVSARRGVDYEQMPLAPEQHAAEALPEGTVVFSIGQPSQGDEEPPLAFPGM